jgi:hypothetical protein
LFDAHWERRLRNGEPIPEVGTTDRFILNLDEGLFGALYRVLIGFATIPTMRFLLGSGGSDWMLAPFLLFVLLLLRIGLAVVRKVAPFSLELQEAWSVRRRTAKLYDSYQWRKLMWVGAGLACYVMVSGSYGSVPIGLSMFCLTTGASATVRWRVVSANSKFPKPTARKIKSAAA